MPAHRWRLAGALSVGAAALAAAFAVTSLAASSVGQPPPEVAAAEGDAWPAHNFDLSNSRATTRTQINATNVATLKRKWAFKIPGTGVFGNYASTPIVFGGTVYLQDLNSNVYALDQQTGKLKWKHAFKSPSIGPNGVSIGYGRLYGATVSTAFALNPATGALIWKHKLTPSIHEGIDMAPQLYDGKVLVSTVPGSGIKHFYEPHAVGIVYSLDAATGKTIWSFNTVPTPKKGSYSGGGLWYPPAVVSEVAEPTAQRFSQGTKSVPLACASGVSMPPRSPGQIATVFFGSGPVSFRCLPTLACQTAAPVAAFHA